jgi:hypothetical protein
MYINNIFCAEEFINLSTVLVPTTEAIVQMCKDKYTIRSSTTPAGGNILTAINW